MTIKMSNQVSLDSTVTLVDGATFEDIISQLQPYVDSAILCIKDGCELMIHRDRSRFPIFIKLESKLNDIYSFRDPTTDSLYSVFGEEAAGIICPSMSTKPGKKIASITREGVTSTVYGNDETATLEESDIGIDT